jgi:hypothetical protein
MRTRFDQLALDAAGYRAAMERIFSRKLSKPRHCRQYFFEVLVNSSRLYLDYLLITKDLPELEKLSKTDAKRPLNPHNTSRETLLRRRFRERLKSLPCWSYFLPENPFSKYTGLWKLEDYINSFALHLPEIHEETLWVEGYASGFLKNRLASTLADLMVGLQHLGCNHVSFVHFALEWAAEESSWNLDSSKVSDG